MSVEDEPVPVCRGVDVFVRRHGCMCVWISVKKKTKRKKKTYLEPGKGGRGHADVFRVHADTDEYKEE